ncbi:unnamed protein product [Gadus morhua 'NCC']
MSSGWWEVPHSLQPSSQRGELPFSVFPFLCADGRQHLAEPASMPRLGFSLLLVSQGRFQSVPAGSSRLKDLEARRSDATTGRRQHGP